MAMSIEKSKNKIKFNLKKEKKDNKRKKEKRPAFGNEHAYCHRRNHWPTQRISTRQ